MESRTCVLYFIPAVCRRLPIVDTEATLRKQNEDCLSYRYRGGAVAEVGGIGCPHITVLSCKLLKLKLRLTREMY